jgi:predicted dehydrogenase
MYTSQGIETVSSAGYDFDEAMRKQIEHFAQCIQEHQMPKQITVPEALHGIAIADAIMRSTSSGGTSISF